MPTHDTTRQLPAGRSSDSNTPRGDSDNKSWNPFYALSAICATERDAFERRSPLPESSSRPPLPAKSRVAPQLEMPQDSLDLLSHVACLCPPDASPHTPTHLTVPDRVHPCTPDPTSTASSPMASPAPRTPSPRPAAYEAHIARGTTSPKKPVLIIDALKNPRMTETLPYIGKNKLLSPIALRRPSRFPKLTLDAVAEAKRKVVRKEDITPDSDAEAVLNARKAKLDEVKAELESWQQSRLAMAAPSHPVPGSVRTSGIKRKRQPNPIWELTSRRVKPRTELRPPLAAKVTDNGSTMEEPTVPLDPAINTDLVFKFYTGPQAVSDA